MKKHFQRKQYSLKMKKEKNEGIANEEVERLNKWKKKLSMEEYCRLKSRTKVKFRSRRKAFQFKLKLNARGTKYKVYQCDKCQKWHLTKLTIEQYEEKKAYYNELYGSA